MKKSKQNELRKARQAKQTNRNWIQKLTDACEGFFLDIFDAIGLWAFVDWYLKKQEAMRYLVFGALSTIVNIGVFALCDWPKVLPVLISNTIAWIAAVIFAYITNRYCVFVSKKHSRKEIAKELSSFIAARVITLIIESIFMWITIEQLHWHSILMKVIANIIVIVLNFFFSKLFIFKNEQEA
jgi:putative flippase GtrA